MLFHVIFFNNLAMKCTEEKRKASRSVLTRLVHGIQLFSLGFIHVVV